MSTDSERFIRTSMLITDAGLNQLKHSTVAVCGLGGVGSYAAEALARSGVGELIIIDCDPVEASNINRQLPALCSTVGLLKTDIMKERILDINPDIKITALNLFLSPQCDPRIFTDCDYILDAVDNVTAKLWLVETASTLRIPILSAMGCANKLNPCLLEISDIYKTSVCPLCRVMRKELKTRGIDRLTVVYSKEPPIKPVACGQTKGNRPAPASMIFVPASAGLLMAQRVICELADIKNE